MRHQCWVTTQDRFSPFSMKTKSQEVTWSSKYGLTRSVMLQGELLRSAVKAICWEDVDKTSHSYGITQIRYLWCEYSTSWHHIRNSRTPICVDKGLLCMTAPGSRRAGSRLAWSAIMDLRPDGSAPNPPEKIWWEHSPSWGTQELKDNWRNPRGYLKHSPCT